MVSSAAEIERVRTAQTFYEVLGVPVDADKVGMLMTSPTPYVPLPLTLPARAGAAEAGVEAAGVEAASGQDAGPARGGGVQGGFRGIRCAWQRQEEGAV